MSIAHSLIAWAQEQRAEVVPPKSEWEAARITVKDGVALIYRNKGAGTDRICRWVRDVLNASGMPAVLVDAKLGGA